MQFYKTSQINVGSLNEEFNSFSFAKGKAVDREIFKSRSPDSAIPQKAFIVNQKQIKPNIDLINNDFQTFRPGEHNEIKDQNVKDLLGEIDILLNKIGQEPYENTSNDYMIRTGNFAAPQNKQQLQEEGYQEGNDLFSQSLSSLVGRKNPFEEPQSENPSQKQYQINPKSSMRPKSANSKKKVTIADQESPKFKSQKFNKKQSISSNDSSLSKHRKNKAKRKHKQSSSSSSSDQRDFKQKDVAKQQIVSPPKSQLSVAKSQSSFKSAIDQELEIFCISCEEFISQMFIDNHIKQCKVKQILNDLSYINEKLIKILFLLTRKTRAFADQNLVKASKVIQTISDQVIQENDNSYIFQKFSDDLRAIRELIETGSKESNSFIILHTILIKIQEFTLRKQNLIPKHGNLQKLEDQFTSYQPFLKQKSGAPDPEQYFSQPGQQPTLQSINSRNSFIQVNKTRESALGMQKRKKKLFEVNESKPELIKNLFLQNRSSQNLVVMGASKAQRILISKENNNEYEYRSITPVKRKQGIIYGNEVLPDNKLSFIILSSSKKEKDKSQSQTQKELKSNNKDAPVQAIQKQIQFDENNNEIDFKKKAQSVISGISGFLSKITYLTSAPPLQANTETQKKRFFNMAVRQKNKLSQDHPAQNIVIADLYQICQRYEVEEAEWENWILQFYLKTK